MSGVSAPTPFSHLQLKPKTNRCSLTTSVAQCRSSFPELKRIRLRGASFPELKSIRLRRSFSRLRRPCRSSSRPGDPGSGDNDNRTILDAFFLGKALAEALNERIESTVGELLSAVGRLQAEQQKQVQDFQEDVLERAKRAKEKAAREAIEAQGAITKSTTVVTPAATDAVATAISPSSSDSATTATGKDLADKDPLLGNLSND